MRSLALLIRKDFIFAMSSYSNPVILVLLFLSLIAINAPLLFIMFVYFMVVNLFAAEENDLVCNVTAILPIRMRQAVLARYVYTWLLLLAIALLGGGVSAAANLWILERTGWLVQHLFGLAAALFMVSVIMPLNYKFGVLKTRIFSLIFYVFMVAAATAVSTLFTSGFLPAGQAPSLGGSALAAAAVGVALALSVVSLFLSMAIKKH